jgi:hypothetical protein
MVMEMEMGMEMGNRWKVMGGVDRWMRKGRGAES